MREGRRKGIAEVKVMDAKYNHFIDSVGWRVVLNLAGFTVWLTIAIGLLSFTK